MYPGDHVQGLDPRGLDIGLPAPGDPLIAVKYIAVGKPFHYRLMTLLTTRRSSHAGDLRVVRRYLSRGWRSKLDSGLCLRLRPPFRQQAVPVNRSRNLVARAIQVFQHSIRTCVLPPTHDVNPRYHHSLSRLASPSLPSPRANWPRPNVHNNPETHPDQKSDQLFRISSRRQHSSGSHRSPVAIHGRVALSHLPEDEAINIGLAVNGRERVLTRAMARDSFYENYNPAACVSLTRQQVTNSEVTFVATTITKAFNEQLDPVFITRQTKTLKSMDCRQFPPSAHC